MCLDISSQVEGGMSHRSATVAEKIDEIRVGLPFALRSTAADVRREFVDEVGHSAVVSRNVRRLLHRSVAA
jgi:hypothetical protein